MKAAMIEKTQYDPQNPSHIGSCLYSFIFLLFKFISLISVPSVLAVKILMTMNTIYDNFNAIDKWRLHL